MLLFMILAASDRWTHRPQIRGDVAASVQPHKTMPLATMLIYNNVMLHEACLALGHGLHEKSAG